MTGNLIRFAFVIFLCMAGMLISRESHSLDEENAEDSLSDYSIKIVEPSKTPSYFPVLDTQDPSNIVNLLILRSEVSPPAGSDGLVEWSYEGPSDPFWLFGNIGEEIEFTPEEAGHYKIIASYKDNKSKKKAKSKEIEIVALKVSIEPSDPGQTGINGSLINGVAGALHLKHYVSPKQQDAYIVLRAKIEPPDTRFPDALEWCDDAVHGDIPDTAKVSRSQPVRLSACIEIREDASSSGTVIIAAELPVWIVWANFDVLSLYPITVQIGYKSTNGKNLAVATQMKIKMRCLVQISPINIITSSDIPDLSGTYSVITPGGKAEYKWDTSRQIAKRVYQPSPPIQFYPPIMDTDFPNDPLNGNDDLFLSSITGYYEENNPYNDYPQIGTLQDVDSIEIMVPALRGSDIGSEFEHKIWFKEFVRLQIGDNWYLISEHKPYRIDFKLIKIDLTELLFANQDLNNDGDKDDLISEQYINLDCNSDGDKNDICGIWVNNGSYSAYDLNGLP